MSEEIQELPIDSVVSEWKEDCQIDESNISYEIVRTPSLHAKYLQHFVEFKNQLSTAKRNYGKMGNIKRKYYRGECTKQELDKYGWNQFQGLKPSISEMNSLLEFDTDMLYLKRRVSDAETAVSAIEYIMKQISQREYSLKTLFEFTKYINGA